MSLLWQMSDILNNNIYKCDKYNKLKDFCCSNKNAIAIKLRAIIFEVYFLNYSQIIAEKCVKKLKIIYEYTI